MKNAILINAYPNNDKKKDILERSVLNFKKLGLPVIVVSGCDIPEHISKHIDYYIINREKFVLGKDYMRKCNDLLNKNNDLACPFLRMNNLIVFTYCVNHNVTIARNTKLIFEFARSIGIDNVLYTEDDNIFNEESFESVRTHLDILNSNQKKFISCWGIMKDSQTKMLFSCLYYANVNFFLEHFKIPTSIEEWNDENTIRKYKLQRAYEESLYICFEPVRDQTHDYSSEYDRLTGSNAIELNLASRYEELSWRINTTFNVFQEFEGSRLFFAACNYTVPTAHHPIIDVKVYIDGVCSLNNKMGSGDWYYKEVTDAHKVSLYINDQLVKEIDVHDIESIKNNGTLLIL